MGSVGEFHYRVPGRAGGYRPGAHRGTAVGPGLDFAGYSRLFDVPDPRRLDLRASLRSARGDWLVRSNRQRAAMSLYAIVDQSTSMSFGARTAKGQVAADFVESMGRSAFCMGDAAGLVTFAHGRSARAHWPARYGRGTGQHLADLLRGQAISDEGAAPRQSEIDHVAALSEAISLLPMINAVLFIVSDYHWPLTGLAPVLNRLTLATVVPIVVWDPAEIEPPAHNGLLTVRDAESGRYRPIWVNDRLREQWRAGVASQREAIAQTFVPRGLVPHYVCGRFKAEALTRYFLERLN